MWELNNDGRFHYDPICRKQIGRRTDSESAVMLRRIIARLVGLRRSLVRFEDEGIFGRTVMFVNLASDPIVERVLVPDMVLKVAERYAVEEQKRVLVLMTDMTAYADALKPELCTQRIARLRLTQSD